MASTKRLPSGGWQVRWKTPERQSRKKNFPTKPEADRFANSVEHRKTTGEYVDPASGRIDFEAWARRWLATTVGLRQSTRVRDEEYLERYLLPTFGPTHLADIDYLSVSHWVASLTARGLAPATVDKAYQILAKIMRTAVQARRIAASPCQGVELPRVERVEMRFLSPDEVATLADAMDRRYSAAVLLGAYGGLRAGELFGLRANRVDLMRRTVDVAEIVTEVRGSLVFGPPKTRAGRRRVPIPALVAEALGEHLGGGGPRDRWVFPAPDGGTVRLASWRRRFWLPATHAAALDGLRIHDLRHTAVSLWLAAGADPVVVARRAGHSSTVTVMDRYGHASVERQDHLTDALDAMARGATAATTAPVRRLAP
jgi:integrase